MPYSGGHISFLVAREFGGRNVENVVQRTKVSGAIFLHEKR